MLGMEFPATARIPTSTDTHTDIIVTGYAEDDD